MKIQQVLKNDTSNTFMNYSVQLKQGHNFANKLPQHETREKIILHNYSNRIGGREMNNYRIV